MAQVGTIRTGTMDEASPGLVASSNAVQVPGPSDSDAVAGDDVALGVPADSSATAPIAAALPRPRVVETFTTTLAGAGVVPTGEFAVIS